MGYVKRKPELISRPADLQKPRQDQPRPIGQSKLPDRKAQFGGELREPGEAAAAPPRGGGNCFIFPAFYRSWLVFATLYRSWFALDLLFPRLLAEQTAEGVTG